MRQATKQFIKTIVFAKKILSTQHSLAKIMPTLQAISLVVAGDCMFVVMRFPSSVLFWLE